MSGMTNLESTSGAGTGDRPAQHLGQAILMAIFAPLFGHIALYHAWRLGVLYERGDQGGAQEQSCLTEIWLRAASQAFCVMAVTGIVVLIVLAGTGGNKHLVFY